MSSEDKSLDPSDHGQSTPLSSTGGRTPSPAPIDRRTRGRPRRDAGSGLPTPRKKGRSRGRAQVEDEDSMDGTETAEAENMQDMEVKELVLDVEEEIMVPSLRDGRPLSPLFQRSMSEDSAGSSASTLEHAKVREKLCAFCYCGERSFLGQGDLMVFGPTPGYVPLHIRNRRGSSEKDDDYHEDDFQDDHHDTKIPGQRDGGRGLKKVSSPDSGLHSSSAPGSTDPFSEEQAAKFWDELGQIGLPDDINVQSLFDPTGQCCAHLHCAAWSEGVCRGEAQDSLLYVDKAIDSGSTECCAYCKRLGASIKCCEEGCCRSYHFPCAAASGTFQDLRRHTLLCPDHLQLASQRCKEVKCLLCGSAGDLQDLLFCSSCGQHYHGACLDVSVTPLKRAGWQCPECKVCLTCRNPGEDSKMLVCDMCDKGYHTFCLQPTMKSIPTNGWRCKNCRVCSLCGVRQAGQWAHNITLCEGCHGQPEEPAPVLPCPLCVRDQGRGDAPKDLLLTCHTCKRWLHGECEKQAGGNSDLHTQADYICTICKQVESDMVETPASPIQESTEPEPEPTMDVFMAVVEEDVLLEEEARPSPRLEEEEEARPSPRLEEEEEARPSPRLEEEEEARPSPRLEEEEEARPSPRLEEEEEARPSPRLEEEEEARPSPRLEEEEEEARPSPRLEEEEEEARPSPRLEEEEEARPSPRLEEEEEARPSPRLEEEEEARPSPRLEEEEEARPSPRLEEEEEARPSPRLEEEEEARPSPRLEEEEEARPSPRLEEEARPSPRLEEEARPSPRLEEEARPSPRLEEEARPSPRLEEEARPSPRLEEEARPSPRLEEEARPSPRLEEEARPSPRLEEEARPSPRLEEEARPSPRLEEEARPSPRLEEEARPSPRLEEEARPSPRLEEEARPSPRLEEEARPSPRLEEEARPSPRLEEEARPSPRLEEEARPSPRLEEEEARPSPRLEEEEARPSPRLEEEEARPSPRLEEEEARPSPRLEEEEARPSPRLEEEEARPSPRLEEEEARPSPRLEEEEARPSPRLEEEEARPSPRLEEEEARPSPRLEEEEARPSPRLEEEEARPSPRLEEEEARPSPRLEEEEARPSPRLEEEEARPSPRLEEEEARPSPRLEEEEARPSPRLEEEEARPSPRLEEEARPSPRLEEEEEEARPSPRLEEEEEARPGPRLEEEEEARPGPRLEEEETAARPGPRLEEETAARPGPLKKPKVSPSGVELAQEIQVTVTLTEGRESHQRSGTLVDVSPLASQSPASPVDDVQQELEISDSLQMGKGAAPEEALPCDVEGEETKSEDSKTTLAMPTNEISHEALEETTEEAPVEEEEPMEVAPVEMKSLELAAMETTVEQNVMEPMQEVQDAVAEKEFEEKLEDEELPPSILDEGENLPPIVLDEGEVLLPNVLPIAEDKIREKELSPMAELPEMESPVDMDIMHASNRSLSDFSSPRGDGKASKASPEMSPELSLMLIQSLFPTESFPREASPPWVQVQIQAQAAPPQTQPHSGYSACVPPTTTTFFPLTPKIGMGKPAISKRKFSPGRPRVKQGAWSNHRAASPPSWSQQDPSEGGWDGPKNRQLQEVPVWSMRVGRGSGFPGRRRPRGANLSVRGGRGRSRGLKADTTLAMTPGASFVEQPYMVKEEEENAMHNTVVIFSTSDHFTLRQDMCVVCGSFGQGSEGRLLACSQCGQCYHPFCVNIKITRVVLSKGWRCLECTVCEACGQASDPGRLLLCDNCDISYHTYCLDPPLQTVPKGSWKCKWCVSCTQCGATSPGMRCDWQNNYTQCGPCASLASCPMCMRSYCEDELIVQCRQCDRWIHACCQGLDTDEEVENAADDGFDCTMCRMHALPSQGKVEALLSDGCEAPMVAQIVSTTREPDIQKTYTQDGVCLTESGLCQLESLAVPSSTRRGQNRRPKPKLKLKIINQNSVAVLQTPPYPHYSELSRDGDGYMDDRRGDLLMDCDLKSDSSLEREPVDDDAKGAEGADGNKKRKRRPYRPGIGGFMVRQRSRTGQGKAKRSLSRKYSAGSLPENPMCKEEGWNKTESTQAEETPPVSECLEKVKKRYRKKRTKLEEEFPSYLQEAFFGKELLDRSKQSRQAGLVTTGLSEENSGVHAETKPRSVNASFLDPSSDPLLSATSTTIPISSKGGGLHHPDFPEVLSTDADLLGMLSDDPVKQGNDSANSEDPLVDLPEVLSTDADLLGMLSDDLVKQGNDSAGLDIAPISDYPIGSCQGSAGRGPRALQEEPLDVILSPELDKMVVDGAILSKLYKIPELEGKDVEDLFTAVLSPSTSQPPQLSHPGANGPGAMALPNPGDGGMFPQMPMINGMMGPNPHFPPTPMMPGGTGPCGPGNFSPIHRIPFQENMRAPSRDKKFSQMGGDVVVPWSAPVPGPLPEGETDTMSNAQRSTLKWEKEETLGEMATVAPVLYTNVNFPNLLGEFPDWAMRVKQIAKLWRKASSQDRAPYVQKARDNRAALRINKVQMSNDTLKRHENPHQQPLTDPFDPNSVPMDAELLFKDTLKPKESEHEQEWKFRQGELNQMWGPLKTQQEKVQKSKALKSTNKDVLFGHSNQATIAAGGGKMSLQMRQKSKQQAKIEATQKLEQVKNEQQQLQQQQLFSSQSCGDATPNSGNQSPMTPQPCNGGKSGNSSPLQPIVSKDGFARPQLPVTPTPGSQDDVFLRPQPLPPSSRTPTQETSYPQQGPSSELQSSQMFSPSSSSGSRPSSPWDPYAKIVGTPRPPPGDGGSTTPQQNSLSEMQERGGRHSPAHESFGSPTSGNADPYAKMPDTPRPPEPFVKPMGPARVGPSGLVEQQQKQQVRHMMSPPSGGEAFARIGGHRAEVYQRMSHNRMILSDPYSRPLLTPIPGSNESGSVPVFKAPMPPQQEPYGGPMPGGLRRGPSNDFPQGSQADPYAQQPLTIRPPMGEGFPNEPRMMRQPQEGHFSQPMPMMRHPHRNSYSQAPSTPRPDYSQQMPEPYAQPPGTPRPHSDGHAQPPGTPRPHSDPSYLQTPPSLHLDQLPQQHPANRRQSPSHSIDPYASMPGTPRPAPGDRFPKSPASQRNMDPYAQQPGTHRPSNAILYAQPPGTPRPLLTNPYAQASGMTRPGAGPDAFNRLGSRPIPMSQLPADPFSHQSPGRMQDTFAHPSAPGPQISKHPEMSDESFSLPQSNHHGGQTPIHDPFEQGPMTPCAQASERPAHDIPQLSSNTVAAQNSMQPHLGDTEEKLRQRQRLRQLILRQQQQKTAIRQEKGLLQEAGGATGVVTPRHWSQEDPTPQSHMFGRPPPPYPGPMRGGPQVPGGQRFPGTFLGDQRGPFPNEGQFAIPHFPRDMGLRPQGMRFGFLSGQEQHFLRPPQQMPGGPMVDNIPPQMRRSLSVDFSRGGNPLMGLPQDFPPQGLTVQQHNIMGQPFIELRHRAPENRMKIPFGHGPPDVMDPSNQTQRPPQCFMGGQEIGFARNQGPRMMAPMMGRPSQGSVGQMQMLASMENLHQQQTEVLVTTEQQQHPPLNRSLSHPVTSESLKAEPSGMLLPGSSTGQTEETQIPSGDGIDENLDADDSAVKDLEDVEVKDLVDLNLNLDPDDGKDLDLGPNDLHLDDFLMSGKFDLIAYTDPELNLDDKKDMFSEDLDLGDPMEEHQQGETLDLQKALSEKRNASGDCAATSSQSVGKSVHGQIRREANKSKETLDIVKIEETIKTEVKDGHMQNQDQPLCSGRMNDNRTMTNQEGAGLYEQPGQTVSAPVLSNLLVKEKLENTGLGPTGSPHQGNIAAQPNQATGLHPNPGMQHTQDNNRLNPSVAMGHRVNPVLVQSRLSMGNPNHILGGNHSFRASANQQMELNLAMVGASQQPTAHGLNPQGQQGSSLGQAGPQNRPLLLDEQPLLLQDLLDQERQEQQQQRHMQAMIRQRSSDSFFPNIADFDAVTDPIMKAKMVALKGINKVMAQNSMGMPSIVINSNDPLRIQHTPGAHGPDAAATLPPHVFGQDGKLAPQMARPNPPNFGPGFVNDGKRKQYEEWLKETQQLLQMQQKFLEDQIGAHRKSKKALSAKQRTAKKAGREFPKEDVEQLKHVTEQQSVVQKQLEQIRKQQKDHAELIEEYRVKQQQLSLQAPMMPGMPPMPGMSAHAAPMMPREPPLGQPMMTMQPHPSQPNLARMPNVPGWHPGGAPGPMGGPGLRIPAQMPPASPAQLHQPQLPPQTQLPPQPQSASMVPGVKATPAGKGAGTQGASGGNGGGGSNSLAVKFDDNNPFSEGFQERERRDRMREQQERQRVQLMQEVDRHRAMQQRLEMEQQGLGMGPAGLPHGSGATNHSGDSLAHMPFYNTDLPQDFMQPSRPQQQAPPQQGQLGPMYSQQGIGAFMMGDERRPMPKTGAFGGPEMGPNFRPENPMLQGPNFPSGQPRPARFGGPGMMPQSGGRGEGQGLPFGMDSSTPLPPNYPGSGQSLIQLYSNIIPEEKVKKKRNRKKKRDSVDDIDSVKTPSTPHSDRCSPLTPSRGSDTSSTRSLSIPGEQDLSDLFLPVGSSGLAPSTELERQLSGSSLAQDGCSSMGSENDRAPLFDETLQIKLESIETECRRDEAANEGSALQHVPRAGGTVKVEEGSGGGFSSPLHGAKGGDTGNELLKHLLKNKSTPPPGANANQTLPTQQMSCDKLRSEQEDSSDHKATARPASTANNMTPRRSQLTGSTELLETSVPEQGKRKQQRNKLTHKNGVEKPPSRYKRRKKEEEEKQIGYSSTDTLMTQLKQQLSLLPLIEPLMGVNFAHFPPFGSGQLNGENSLSGSFGSASLGGVSDYYSQLIYKQNNLSNPPTPPASLPPTPPPVARQKMVNGFATAEELTRKAAVLGGHDAFRTEKDLLAHAITQGPKTVDVPASLPTPPHNNQEELRSQDHCADRDTPDSFVPSSSPESVVGMEISRYPDLSNVKEEPPSPCSSPVIPMLPSASGKGTEIKREVKTEPSSSFFGSQFRQAPSCSKAGLVSIAITLNPVAAENIPGMVAAVADLLCVNIPVSYEVSCGPERSSLALLAGVKVPQTKGVDPHHTAMFPQQPPTMRFLRPPGPHTHSGISQQPPTSAGPSARGDGPKPQWCWNCKVLVLGNGVRKSTKDLPCSKRERPNHAGGSMVFCSHNCFVLHTTATQSKAMDSKPNMSPLLPESSVKESPSKVLHQYSNNMSTLDVHCLAQLQPKQSPPSSPHPISFPSEKPKPDTLKVTVKFKPRPRAVHSASGGGDMSPYHHKRWKGLRWRKWSVHIVVPTSRTLLSSLPGEDEMDKLLRKLGASLRPDPFPRDLRRCCFCHEEGDGVTDGPARLLNLDLDLWVHLNCALWSSEVYETQAGALINVELALRRGMAVRCAYCQQTGATSRCHRLRCANAYHFTCALKAQCTFFKDKTMLCHLHRPRGSDRAVASATNHHDHELRCFAVFRRVYVQRDEARQMASIMQSGEHRHTFRVGSLVFHTVGQLLPQQMSAFHSANAIFPVGYRASRIYWSTRHGNRRCRYLCSVEENEGRPEFVVRVMEQGYDDLVLTGASPKGVWDKILEPVAERRNESGTLKLFPVYLKGEDLFGFTVTAVTRIVESLPGVEACESYTFRFGRNPLMDLPLAINPTGSARSEPKTCTHVKRLVLRSHTLSSTGGSSKSMQTVGSVGVVEAPEEVTPKEFASIPFQYRRMKAEWKSNVYLARSRIQGLGLYAARDIESHTMVIEYIGTLIRNEVANRMEKMYESQNRGVYMFRLDSEHVVDATITGGPARYINHSCAPNCITEAVSLERGVKIVISSCRNIQRGEELCYDYKFDLEDDQHKIPCHCGAVNCRKWMN
ncbi:histone-lysine N-methyltransferase 2C-like isoform X7 [Salvelinus fontinalis]|uniref:histone-lysine N-methyltransferase 2C-like isoform X7 n=1 Tax=Salvelinus fontinalis TaxID=8038 RepID=UPI0024869DDF|nr:histone-lysine N-methyltransferase 2C-like isoform X7 [Salvelinus fontinalis]